MAFYALAPRLLFIAFAPCVALKICIVLLLGYTEMLQSYLHKPTLAGPLTLCRGRTTSAPSETKTEQNTDWQRLPHRTYTKGRGPQTRLTSYCCYTPSRSFRLQQQNETRIDSHVVRSRGRSSEIGVTHGPVPGLSLR